MGLFVQEHSYTVFYTVHNDQMVKPFHCLVVLYIDFYNLVLNVWIYVNTVLFFACVFKFFF